MGNSKQKRKPTREPQLSANSRASRKIAKQYVVHRMFMTSLERKTSGDVYGNIKKLINDAISVSPCMTEYSLKCAAIRNKQKISNNQILDKEESEEDKSEHQTSLLIIISSTTTNDRIPKGSTLKNKKKNQERIYKGELHLTHLFLEEKKNMQCLTIVTFYLLYNYVMNNYDRHDTSLSISADTIRGRAKYGTTA